MRGTTVALGALGVALLGLVATDGCGYTTDAEGGAAGADAAGPDAPPFGDSGADGARADGATLGPPLAECAAQRVVTLVGGTGGLAWFTQVWPLPDVITGFQPGYAYDAPSNAKLVPTAPGHPLYARLLPGARVVWEGVGVRPMPTVFVAGQNQTHTSTPTFTRQGAGPEILGAAWGAQKKLGAPIAAVRIARTYAYGPTGSPPVPIDAADVSGAIKAMTAQLSLPPNVVAQLTPEPGILGTWYSSSAPTNVKAFAEALLFAANAFRLNLVANVQIPAFEDDPHGAFTSAPTQRVNDIATILDAFYKQLAVNKEATCGHLGAPLSLADNVLMLAYGDTYKSPFSASGWPDSTPGNTNLAFVRSNGFLAPGFFGRITDASAAFFDPATGSPGSTTAIATEGALEAILYAIVRGDGGFVSSTFPTGTPYQGTLEASPP